MSIERRRKVAGIGGRAAQAKGTAHRFTSKEAEIAGRKGGKSGHKMGMAHEFTPREAVKAGRKGGKSHGSKRRE